MTPDRSLASFLFESFPGNLLAGLNAGGGGMIANFLTKVLLEQFLLHEITLLALLLLARAIKLAHDEANAELHGEIEVLGK